MAQPTPPRPGALLLKQSRSPLQPDVWRVPATGGGGDTVWKTFSRHWWPLRVTACRWLARREARNLAALDGIPGLPRFLGQPDPFTVEMSLLDATPIPETKRDHGLPPAFFDELDAIVAEIHARGLNHGDLRRRNVMVRRDDGGPALVDFAQSLCSANPIERLGLGPARKIDRAEFLKLKRWYLGAGQLSAEEGAELERAPWHLRLGRFLRHNVYRRAKRLLRGDPRWRK